MALRANSYGKKYITTATTTVVKNGPAVLKRIVVNVPVSTGTITIYDDLAAGTTTPIAIITSTADLKPFSIDFDCQMTNGIQVVTTQSQNITVVYG